MPFGLLGGLPRIGTPFGLLGGLPRTPCWRVGSAILVFRMSSVLSIVAYRGRPLTARDLQTLVQEELGRLAAAGGTLALRQVASIDLPSLFPGRSVDPGEVHFLELSIEGGSSEIPNPTPAEVALPDDEALGTPLWHDVLALHVSRASGAALTVLLDDAQQVGYYGLFLRGERVRSTWLAANRRRVDVVESKIEAARPAPEAQGGEHYAVVPVNGLELFVGDAIRAGGKVPAGGLEQVYYAVFEAGRPATRWRVARDGKVLPDPEVLPEEQAKALRPVP